MRMNPLAAIALAAAFGLSACDRSVPPAAPTAEPVTTPATPATPSTAPVQAAGGLAIEGEGLRIFDVEGAARALPFGTPQETVINAVRIVLAGSAPEQSTNEECGQGPTQFATYPGGLQLLFQDEKFNGWFLDQAGLTTVDGVGVGSTRAALETSRTIELTPGSTLGTEFASGDLFGFLTSAAADATVESLWAGGNCFFR